MAMAERQRLDVLMKQFAFFTILSLIHITSQSSDFDNARVVGYPKLKCGPSTISFQFETSVPFQGRVTIVERMLNPRCQWDFSSNIMTNASFLIDIAQCMDVTVTSNGSRVVSSHVEIGFHPLVITTSDRIFSVTCTDSHSVKSRASTENIQCTHVIRHASRWDSSTIFHVGDPVVHEWSCSLPPADEGRMIGVLTNCNAVSQQGEQLHLIDENGCTVDSELLGDLVYNNYQVKVYVRARMFKFLGGVQHRIECKFRMCSKSDKCGTIKLPPKCAFTKEEILERYEKRNGVRTLDDQFIANILPESTNFTKDVVVRSEWLTIHHNEYTNIDTLHERYYLTTVMDLNLNDMKDAMPKQHFLMGISYRDPKKTEYVPPRKTSQPPKIEHNRVFVSPAQIPYTKAASELEDIAVPDRTSPSLTETTTTTIAPSTSRQMKTNMVEEAATIKFYNLREVEKRNKASSVSPYFIGILENPPTDERLTNNASASSGSNPKAHAETQAANKPGNPFASQEGDDEDSEEDSDMDSSSIPFSDVDKMSTLLSKAVEIATSKPTAKEKVVERKPVAMETQPLQESEESSSEEVTTLEQPFQMLVSPYAIREVESELKVTDTKRKDSSVKAVHSPSPAVNKEFPKHKEDWRFDDVALNDTETGRLAAEFACSNATFVASAQGCRWSGLEQILVVWSLGSLLVWIVLFGVFFYRYNSRRPDWVERTEFSGASNKLREDYREQFYQLNIPGYIKMPLTDQQIKAAKRKLTLDDFKNLLA